MLLTSLPHCQTVFLRNLESKLGQCCTGQHVSGVSLGVMMITQFFSSVLQQVSIIKEDWHLALMIYLMKSCIFEKLIIFHVLWYVSMSYCYFTISKPKSSPVDHSVSKGILFWEIELHGPFSSSFQSFIKSILCKKVQYLGIMPISWHSSVLLRTYFEV